MAQGPMGILVSIPPSLRGQAHHTSYLLQILKCVVCVGTCASAQCMYFMTTKQGELLGIK